jgi:hypothetical protein
MPRATPLLSSFNSGELTPFLDGRVDNPKYASGLSICENFLPTLQGPLTRCPGTLFIDTLKQQSRAIPFTFSIDQNYVLEFGAGYLRFWRSRAQLLSGGVPYEIVTPFTLADIDTMRFVQSADVLYLACGRINVQKLTRIADTNWAIAETNFQLGPLADQNTDQIKSMWYEDANPEPGAVGNVITLRSDFNIFTSDYIGQLIELEWVTRPDLRQWQVDVTFDIDEQAYYLGNVYRSLVHVGTTGTSPPTQTEGEADDGGGGKWLYLHSGYGLMRITSITDATTATAIIVQRLPIEIIGSTLKTYRWSNSPYSNAQGWPIAITFFRERLVLMGARRIDMSVVSDYEHFNRRDAGEFLDDLAISIVIGSGRVDPIEWTIADANGLVIGTRGQEFLVDEASTNAPFGAKNFRIRPQSQFGSQNNAQVCQVGDTIVYAQRTGKRLLSAQYDFASLRLVSENLSIYSEHILQPTVADMVYQQNPYSIVWIRLSDGTLAAWTYDRLNGVIAGYRRPMVNGVVESICAIPSPDGTTDDLWLFIRRRINGVTVRYAEIITCVDPMTTALADSFFVDCGLVSVNASPVTSVSGAEHLAGQTVQMLVDGAVQAPQVVPNSGVVPLQFPGRKIALGLQMTSRMRSMRIEAGAADGTAQGRIGRVSEIMIRFLNTLGGRFGTYMDKLDPIPTRAPGSTNMNQPPPAFTGDRNLPMPGDWNRAGYVCIIQDQPLPMTVVSITAKIIKND